MRFGSKTMRQRRSSPWERGRLARIRGERWPAAGVREASRRPAGSAPEAGRISKRGVCSAPRYGSRRTPLEMRRASAAEARQRRSSPWERGRLARIRGERWPTADVGEASRRPAGSAPEAGRISRRGVCSAPRYGSRRTPLDMRRASAAEARQRRSSPWERGRLARIRGERWPTAGVGKASRRPPGSAPEAGRIATCGIGETLKSRSEDRRSQANGRCLLLTVGT
jgi:hypothetical protein